MKRWLMNVLYFFIFWRVYELLFNRPITDWRRFLLGNIFQGLFMGTIFFFAEKPMMLFIKKQFGGKKKEE